jgi:Rad3-related DNA helicase
MRERQSYVLNEIANALASGYKYILLEAPTGFGKSPVAIAAGRTLGTSYICTSTSNPRNWIVSEIKKENYEVMSFFRQYYNST